MYVHLGFDRGSSHDAEGYRLTGETIDQTKESAENYGDSFSVDCVDNHLSTDRPDMAHLSGEWHNICQPLAFSSHATSVLRR